MIKLTHAIHEVDAYGSGSRIERFQEVWLHPSKIRTIHRIAMTTMSGEKITGASLKLDTGQWVSVTESPEAIVGIEALASID